MTTYRRSALFCPVNGPVEVLRNIPNDNSLAKTMLNASSWMTRFLSPLRASHLEESFGVQLLRPCPNSYCYSPPVFVHYGYYDIKPPINEFASHLLGDEIRGPVLIEGAAAHPLPFTEEELRDNAVKAARAIVPPEQLEGLDRILKKYPYRVRRCLELFAATTVLDSDFTPHEDECLNKATREFTEFRKEQLKKQFEAIN